MTPFRTSSKTYLTRVYDEAGKPHVRSLETQNKAMATARQRFVDEIHDPSPAFAPIARKVRAAIVARTLTVFEAQLMRETGTLASMLAERDATDLKQYLAPWQKALADHVEHDTAQHYQDATESFFGADWRHTHVSGDFIQSWLDGLSCSSGTKRKKAAGLASFLAFVRKRRKDLLPHDPMADVTLPPAGDALTHYLETGEAKLLADAQPNQFAVLSALLAGTGIEVSVALGLRTRQIDVKAKEISAPGTKTYARKRVVRVASWAWPYIAGLAKGKHKDAKLFDQITDRWEARACHDEARALLIDKGHDCYARTPDGQDHLYTMRDARHTYAVRAVRAGTPVDLVARQLGHANATMVVRVYGRFQPSQDERDKWEKIAAAQDKKTAKAAGAVTSAVTSPDVTSQVKQRKSLLPNSRGEI